MSKFRYYFFLVLHIMVLLLWYTSGFWLPWQWVLVTILLYAAQNIFLGYCVLTLGEFGDTHEGFFYHYLTKFGFKVDRKHLNFVLNFVIPFLIILSALIYQKVIFN